LLNFGVASKSCRSGLGFGSDKWCCSGSDSIPLYPIPVLYCTVYSAKLHFDPAPPARKLNRFPDVSGSVSGSDSPATLCQTQQCWKNYSFHKETHIP
jgi:hypothetical protein